MSPEGQNRNTRASSLPYVQLATQVIRDPQLSLNAKLTYAVLATMVPVRTRQAVLFRAEIADAVGKSKDTVDRAIRELTAAAVLKVEKRRTTGGDSDASLYILNDVALGVPDGSSGGRTDAATTPRQDEPPGESGRKSAATSPQPCGQVAATVPPGGRTDAALEERSSKRTSSSRRTADAADVEAWAQRLRIKASEVDPLSIGRGDVEALCARLADGIAAGSPTKTRPRVTAQWRRDARLLIDTDKREVAYSLRLIDWTVTDSFWSTNVLSMPTFREKYEQLDRKRMSKTGQTGNLRSSQVDDGFWGQNPLGESA